eukprot:NODE_4_length_77007_cov_1.156642.p60 type:complete len:165 gc:universal NODE_4_length_77007_cov_1.156642:3503-3997(+)
MDYLFLLSRQGKVRLAQWFITANQSEKQKIVNDVVAIVLSRKQKLANIVEYKNMKVIYKRYASLYFVIGTSNQDCNELLIMEEIHRFVEVLDRYFGNVCELDLIFNFHKAYYILNDFLMSGQLVDTSKKSIVKTVQSADQTAELGEEITGRQASQYGGDWYSNR